MYLKKLVIHGFKSFADRVTLELEPGVTGIVGPNGCGKSNVADAIKWVLGEQSPKSLRASSMQDVLFEGSDKRPPMAFSEVTLLFTDCEKELGTAFNEVEVGRRVERDGGSDYFINSKSCRLKDIHQLFRDTGIGRVAYSFLQQGQIDKLLSANPMDRRTVFEEAAGISSFKMKREETLKKLSDVETNLSRISDILTEVSQQMGSLKRQAAKAAKAQRLKKQVNALDQALISYDLQSLDTQIAEKSDILTPLETELNSTQEKLTSHEESLKTVEGKMGELITQQQGLSSQIFEKRSAREEALSHARFLTLRADEARARIQALELTLETLRNEEITSREELEKIASQLTEAKTTAEAAREKSLAAAQTQEEAARAYETALHDETEFKSSATEQEGQLTAMQAKMSALELESHGLQSQLGPIHAQKEALREEENRVRGEGDQARMQAGVSEDALKRAELMLGQALMQQKTLREQSAAQKETFAKTQHAHLELTAENTLLEELNRRYEGFSAATQTLLQTGDYSPLVEGLKIQPEMTAALSSLLAGELEAVTPKNGAALTVGALHRGERVALTHFAEKIPLDETPAITGLLRALDLIEAPAHLDFLKKRLAGCYVCPDAARFEEIVLSGANFSFVAIANSQGAIIDGRGLFAAMQTGEKEIHAASYLTRSQRLETLQGFIQRSESELQIVKQALTQLDHALSDNELTLTKIHQTVSSNQAQLNSHQDAIKKAECALERVTSQITLLDEQSASSQARVQELANERLSMQAELEALLLKKAENDGRQQALAEQLLSLRTQRDAAINTLSEARVTEAHARHNAETLHDGSRNLELRLSDLAARLQQASTDVERLKNDSTDYQKQAQEKETIAENFSESLNALESKLSSLKDELNTQESLCESARGELETLRESAKGTQNRLMHARLAMGELQTRRSILMEDFQRRFTTTQTSAQSWRQSLYEADFFAKADEQSLETANLDMPSDEELTSAYPLLNRDELMADAQNLRQKLENIGPINESALEDYKEHEGRYTQMRAQVDDLQAAKIELTTALAELESQSSSLFATTFETIRANFSKTFEQLFGGGKADLILSDPTNALTSGIEILARPPGTQLRSLNLLSGGQKTMTAVALLFAIYQVKPSPFCVLDELDAPLDDANIGRFLLMLKDFTRFSQFVIITHNKRTMAAANVLYGVTMQERGVSKIISMRLSQAEGYSKPAPKDEAKLDEMPSDSATAVAAEVAASYSLDSLKEKVASLLKEEKEEETPNEAAAEAKND